ncbi:MAG: 23S rRNA (uracil(1939)-C(5))-methyltransferase RlmD [Candidatus Azotimanducaceae bacterium WSBS_2022_MAG_OTU7]
MKSKDPIEVTVETVANDGCGYTADGKLAVFGALPLEKVIAVPVTRKRRRLYMRSTEVLTSSSHRVEPKCKAAAFCGGCSFQHASHAYQLELKQAQVQQALGAIAPGEWLEPISASSYGYRTKARLGVKYVDKKGRVLVGFREKMKPYIADIDSCPILVDPVSRLIEPLVELISGLNEPKTIPQIEVACGDSDVALIFRHLEAMADEDLQKLQSFGHNHSTQMFLQPGGIGSTHKIFPQDDNDLLHYRLPDYDLDFEFSPQDFTQVNLPVNRLMVARAIELLDIDSSDEVLDAFCGIGNFSLAISRFAKKVTGAEQSASSIARARDNARLNGVENVSFLVEDLQLETSEINGLEGVNKVLLDPPRSGAEAMVKRLASSNVDRVVYVSCNPETLARDIGILKTKGFELRSAGIIDMFPHTTHVESIALLVRQG